MKARWPPALSSDSRSGRELDGSRPGRWLRARLPLTVQGILAARLDRQPAEHKQLLQTLAVIGLESPLGLLRQVASFQDNQLAELQAAEFIYEQPGTGGIEYVFKHALTQQVAYNSLLIERRKQIHECVGEVPESIFTDQLDDHLTSVGASL
jgi:predicted ATPase